MVRAKFRCEAMEPSIGDNGGGTVRLSPVVSGSAENDKFFQYTPGGALVLSTINEAAFDQFEVGSEYYVDVTPAPVPESEPTTES